MTEVRPLAGLLRIPIPAAVIAVVMASFGVLAVPAQAGATTESCDVTAMSWADLGAAMLSEAETVCLGADLSRSGDHLTTGSSPKILDLNGFNLTIRADNQHSSIDVPAAMSLTLQATGGGSFTGYGGEEGAGLGGAGNSGLGVRGHSGAITIVSGSWTVSGGMSGAGLGAGWGGNAGPITIMGGAVTALAGPYGAGIGGGDGGNGNNVTITGGVVDVAGGYLAAGIGGGVVGGGGDVVVSGGIVSATAGCRASAIGSGAENSVPGTLMVLGDGDTVPSGSGTAQTCSLLPVGVAATTSRADGPTGVSFLMFASDETDSAPATTNIGYSYDIVTSIEGVLTEVSASPVAYGELLEPLEDPTAPAGLVFDGWRLTSPSGAAFDFSTPITAPTTLFAGWADGPELAVTGLTADDSLAMGAAGLLAVGLGALLLATRRATRR